MTGFFLTENYTENLEMLVRRSQPRIVPPLATLLVKKSSPEAPSVPEALVKKTLLKFSVPSTANVANGL